MSIKPSVVDIIKALQFGPIVTAFHVPKSFRFYSRGVFDTKECLKKDKFSVNHSVVITGYNMNAKIPYFEMMNSWGDDWGEGGFFKMKIGKLSKRNKGLCFLAATPYIIMPYLE